MSNKNELTKEQKREKIEQIKIRNKNNDEMTVTDEIIELLAYSGRASRRAICNIKDASDNYLINKMFKLVQIGLVKKNKDLFQLKNISSNYKDIEFFIPYIPKEIIEENLKRAKANTQQAARERIGYSSEIISHILNMDISICQNFNEIEDKGYVVSADIKKSATNNDIVRSRVMGVLVDKNNDIGFKFYYCNKTALQVLNREAESKMESLIPTEIKQDIIILNDLSAAPNLFKKEKEKRDIMLDKMRTEVLVYPNNKNTYSLMEQTMYPYFRDLVTKAYPKNHELMYEADIIDEANDKYAMYFIYPDIQRLRRFYLMMRREPHNYQIITLKEYEPLIKSIKEELDFEIEQTYLELDEVINKILKMRK